MPAIDYDATEERLKADGGELARDALAVIRNLRERLAQAKKDLRDTERDAQRAAGDAFVEGRWAEREERGG